MRIGLQPSEPEVMRNIAKPWLLRVLQHPDFVYTNLPSEIKGYIYINDRPLVLSRGAWTITDDIIYLASSIGIVAPITKLGILAAIANLTGLIEDPVIVEVISTRLTQVLSESVKSVYGGFIKSTQQPSRLAIDVTNSKIAAELNGAWFQANGVPTEVNDSWIIMDF